MTALEKTFREISLTVCKWKKLYCTKQYNEIKVSAQTRKKSITQTLKSINIRLKYSHIALVFAHPNSVIAPKEKNKI